MKEYYIHECDLHFKFLHSYTLPIEIFIVNLVLVKGRGGLGLNYNHISLFYILVYFLLLAQNDAVLASPPVDQMRTSRIFCYYFRFYYIIYIDFFFSKELLLIIYFIL